MTDEKPSRATRRNRGNRGKLRRFGEIENVNVEEIFSLCNSSNNKTEEESKVGNGCYVSATAHNKRYYGVLIDKESVKAASMLWFQEEANSLELTRRMKTLKQQQQQQQQQQLAVVDDPSNSAANKKGEIMKEENGEIDNTEILPGNALSIQQQQQQASIMDDPRNTAAEKEGESAKEQSGEFGDIQKRLALSLQQQQQWSSVDVPSNNTAVYKEGETLKKDEGKIGDIPIRPAVEKQQHQQSPLAGDLGKAALNKEGESVKGEKGEIGDSHKRPVHTAALFTQHESKRPKLEQALLGDVAVVQQTRFTPDVVASKIVTTRTQKNSIRIKTSSNDEEVLAPQQVQKFRYVEQPDNNDLGYRVLLCTYADIEAASEDDPNKAKLVQSACQSGGGFVGKYYYQYEVLTNGLMSSNDKKKHNDFDGMRTSMGFNSFLRNTHLPTWFPLPMGQNKVLSILNMKKDGNGNAVWNSMVNEKIANKTKQIQGTHFPMEPRSHYRIGVIGGGIAGLACCTELFRLGEVENIDVEVVLLEGRSRLGGRLFTDKETFKCEDGVTSFPVDLGASWIHGTDHNPLASLAREAGVNFVTASEEVKMLKSGMKGIDSELDEASGQLFDDLLDLAADDCWSAPEFTEGLPRNQTAVRWYASGLNKRSGLLPSSKDDEFNGGRQQTIVEEIDTLSHRYSSDMSVDHAIGNAIKKHKLREFSKLSDDEHRMLLWNIKNVEYALGANISDLSMKFWDSDERHAFEGDHVLIKEGYSTIVDHMIAKLKKRGGKFNCLLDFPVGKVEYSRLSTTQVYPDRAIARRKFVELSDSCCVTSQDEQRNMKFDFVVCTTPLGVLKDALLGDSGNDTSVEKKLVFQPELPFSKRDAINAVGFGLLNKLYLQFASPFWRKLSVLEEGQCLFGNASGVNPHHYMFFDIGKSLGTAPDEPGILMSLISGKEAATCERLSDEEIVAEAMQTLRQLFSTIQVPDPTAFKTTRWGSDRFARGSYTFLPPGTTDQDFQLLQSPVNGNGDSLLLEGSETMRLFFAGEHTTALHPSMAHGAMLSGIRAAKEVFSTMKFSFHVGKDVDRLIPLAIYRRDNPKVPLECHMCHVYGSRVREGQLLAFKRGARQVLVHNNCAEYSPEVGVIDGRWRNVIKAVNRGKSIRCILCNRTGATIGCSYNNCSRCFHFSCAEDTGWRFDRDGKEFFCDIHRSHMDKEKQAAADCNRISLVFFKSKNPNWVMKCSLCGITGDDKRAGKLLAFQSHRRWKQILVHENCARYTNVVDTAEVTVTRMEHEYKNVFDALARAKVCGRCGKPGATIGCADPRCTFYYHFPCSLDTGWKYKKKAVPFCCPLHREDNTQSITANVAAGISIPTVTPSIPGLFQHTLFSQLRDPRLPRLEIPSNLGIGLPFATEHSQLGKAAATESTCSSSDFDEDQSIDSMAHYIEDLELTNELAIDETSMTECLVRMKRCTILDPWSISLVARGDLSKDGHRSAISVDSVQTDGGNCGLKSGDIIKRFNGIKVGSEELGTFKKVLLLMGQEVDMMIEVLREMSS